MDSSAGTGAGLDQGQKKKLKNNNLPQEEDINVEPVAISTSRQLGQDELTLIFRNVVISTQDLLNFRLVNKVWWETATACLRQSNESVICITLSRQIPTDPQEDNNDHDQDPKSFNDAVEVFSCRHKYKDVAFTQLSELINIISNSPKFPSTNVHLHWSAFSAPNYSNYPDLLLFFELHGSKIKTLCPEGFVSYRLLSEILTIYLPKLECLDLSKAELRCSKENDLNHLTTVASNLGSLPLKYLILGGSFRENLSPLLSLPFKLSSVLNINFYFLQTLLKKEQANIRLVAGINFHPSHFNFEEVLSLMQTKFTWNYPKLTKLTLVLVNVLSTWFLPSLVQMNKLLSSSKTSLENLKICIYSDLYSYRSKLEIPPMKNLKCLTFSGVHKACRVDEGERGDCISVFALQDKIPPEKYFPSLVKVRLEKMDLRIPNNFVWLFKFKPGYQGTVVRGCFPNVETLEIENVIWPKIPDAKLFSVFFPNVRVLKTVWTWKWTESLECSFWVMCRLVEFMEIYDDDDSPSEGNSVTEDWSRNVDVFFTGFPHDLCSKLRKEKLPQHINNPVTLNFVRITPSICDLQKLKEFKLRFLQRPLIQVASHVTQAYSFAQMPNTKFILEDASYPPQSNADSLGAASNTDIGLEPRISNTITTQITLPAEEIKNIDENSIPVTSVSDLCKDKLSTILNLVPLFTKELLTLRLVSKLWRDVATEILLQQESCYVTLKIKKIQEIEYCNDRFGLGKKCCVENYRQKTTPLSALTKLITSSPKFPASHVHLHSEVYDATNYGDYSDLLEFFRLHGSKIKARRHYGCLSTKDL